MNSSIQEEAAQGSRLNDTRFHLPSIAPMNVPFPLAAALWADLFQVVPTWTDKEVMIAVGSTIGAAIPVCLFVIGFAVKGARREAKKRAKENDALQKRVKELEDKVKSLQMVETLPKFKFDEIQNELFKAKEEVDKLSKENVTVQGIGEQLKQRLEMLQGSLASHAKQLAAEKRRIRKALEKDGQTWCEKVLSHAPRFKPLDPKGRHMPILSVLNLKGGVGKTTAVTNLGAALDALGYRVLFLDLDLQGSLTGSFLPGLVQRSLYDAGKMLGDFLSASFGAESPSLLNYREPVLPDGKSGIVATTDAQVYAEMNLMIRWVLRDSSRDPRFLLRRELQLKRITNNYDIVLLDCPPVINMCCVNALAASDYVLIPILPSKQATDRVPVLLQRLKEFRDNMNPALSVLGVLANRTHRSELTADEYSRLTLLRQQCKDSWGQEVPQFETFIRQSPEVRCAEDEHRPLTPEDETYASFLQLAREVQEKLPNFCRPGSLTDGSAKEVAS